MHDTVRAVLRDPAFHRSLRRSLADRLLVWLADLAVQLGKLLRQLPSGRSLGVAVVGLIVVFVVVRLVIAARVRGDGGPRAAPRRNATTSDDPWVAADGLAGEGRYEEGAHALYRAVVLALGRMERIRLEPSRTSGDYARELRRRGAPSHAPFRDFTCRFEMAVYGHGGCDAEEFAALRLLAAPFAPRVRAA